MTNDFWHHLHGLIFCSVALALICFAAWLFNDPANWRHPQPVSERQACQPYVGRPCILTFTRGTLTGISWYDTQRDRDLVMSQSLR